ncbi:MAG: hypothetical protein U0790_23690 [Isosphaeraceae bacterium]
MRPDWMADEAVQGEIRESRPATMIPAALAFGVAGLMAVVDLLALLEDGGIAPLRLGEWAWRRWGGDSFFGVVLGAFFGSVLLAIVVWAVSVLPVMLGLLRGRALALLAAVISSGAMVSLTGMKAIGNLGRVGTPAELTSLMPWDLDILVLAAMALILLLWPGTLRWFLDALGLRRQARAEGRLASSSTAADLPPL